MNSNTTRCHRCKFTCIGATEKDAREGLEAHICADLYQPPLMFIRRSS